MRCKSILLALNIEPREYVKCGGSFLWLVVSLLQAPNPCMARLPPPGTNSAAISSLKFHSIPFTFDIITQPHIIVKARIDNRPEMSFVLDTGSTASLVIDRVAADRMQLALEAGPEQPGGTRLSTTPLKSITLVGIDGANDFTFEHPGTAYVVELPLLKTIADGENVVGMIGMGVLERTTTRIDFTHKTCLITSEVHPPLRIARASLIPMKADAEDACFTVEISSPEDRPVEVLLDTGAESTILPITALIHSKPIKSVPAGSATTYELSLLPELLLPAIKLGSFTELNCVVVATDPASLTTLGLNLLSRFVVTMDFRHKTLFLERVPDDHLQYVYRGWTGLTISKVDDDYQIEDVVDDSPAQKASLRPGDVIASVDGRSVSGLTLEAAQRLLSGRANTSAAVTVSHDGHMNRVTFMRISEFDAPDLPLAGVLMIKPAGKPLTVMGMMPGCLAEQSGLRIGDVVIEFNGIHESKFNPEVLGHEYKKSEAVLSVYRDRSAETIRLSLNH